MEGGLEADVANGEGPMTEGVAKAGVDVREGMVCPSGLAGPAPVCIAGVSSTTSDAMSPLLAAAVPLAVAISLDTTSLEVSGSAVSIAVCSIEPAGSDGVGVKVGEGLSWGTGEVSPPYVQSGPSGIEGP